MDLSGPAKFISWTPSDPPRIALDVQDAVFDAGVGAFAVDDPVVRRVRINRLTGPKAQVVLDLTVASSYDVYALRPQGAFGHRLVCDVHRSAAPPAPKPAGPWVVVIDPGHGGRDPGARSPHGDREKTICLDVARELERLLDAVPGVEAHLTRRDDVYLPLRTRSRKAAEHDADAFVSIHVNAAPSSRVRGAEVFFLSLQGATDEATRELERLENRAGGVQEAAVEEEVGNLPFALDLRLSDTILRSSLLAESILSGFEANGLAASRGVKQARFVVLKSVRIPSALVELGFMSNPDDLKRLRDGGYRRRLARLLRDGIIAYKTQFSPAKGP